ncbi:MAG: polysaccharide pyruvyl transferase family protein [Deltaproteobacteria bacterium]|jgi:polysaccharide pyruvyl transferase WcaK-like protein
MIFSHSIPFPLQVHTHQMFTGLGAGNIGDELMMLGFLKLIKPCEGSAIEIWDASSPAIRWFPEKYRYLPWRDDSKCEQSVSSSQAVLLVGGTPVSHLAGLDWPLRALKRRLLFCHDSRIPVHAVGIGVDHLNDPDARKMFQDSFLPITSWTVRSANCCRALIALGVSDNRIVIASDLAWLYEPVKDCTAWALSQWKHLGVDFNRPLIGVNVVSEIWGKNSALYKNIALALDRIAESHHAQIAFMCNEVREGEYFDHAAALSVMDIMEAPAIFLPSCYYHPDEMIGHLAHVDVSLSQRYHFTIQSVIAGTVPVSFARGQKLAVLIEELGMNPVGDMDSVNPDTICRNVTDALERRDYWRWHLLQMKKHLRLRAMNNGCFIKQLSAAPVQPRYLSTTTEGYGIVSLQKQSLEERCTVQFESGWFDEEFDASGSWRWSDNLGTIELHCIKDNTVSIEFELGSVPLDNRVSISLNDQELEAFEVDWSGFQKISPIVVHLKKGVQTMAFCSHKPSVTLPSDSRPLAFSIKNFTIDSK